jgi:thiol-disulfide isomerase/thioredoxin
MKRFSNFAKNQSKVNRMKKLFFLFSILFAGSMLFAQEINKIVPDPDKNSNILIGRCNREGLQMEPFKTFFEENYNKYTSDENITKQLKKKMSDVKILIVMGTWCGDSKEQVPAFYKILDDIKFSDAHVEIVAVDRKKAGGDIDVSSLNIERVPTFIFYRNYREIGRIVEKPSSTLEKSMLLILSQE